MACASKANLNRNMLFITTVAIDFTRRNSERLKERQEQGTGLFKRR
jgi:hypothetical protein